MYIIKERNDGKWEVKKEGNTRASEVCNTKGEAIEYCKARKLDYKIDADIVNNISKTVKKHGLRKTLITLFIIIILLLGAFAGLYFTDNLDFIFKKNNKPGGLPGTVEGANYSVHFLEVGNEYTGDATYIKAGDIDILIDAGSRKSSSTTIANYIDKYVTDGKLEYVVATHAHQDHIAGFVGSNSDPGIFERYRIDTLIDFALTETTSQLYGDYLEKRELLIDKGTKHYTADMFFDEDHNPKDNVIDLGNDMSLTILYNEFYFNDAADENDYSVCTLFSNKNNHFLLTGDLEEEGELSLARYYDGSTNEKTLPEVDVFKAGHHGSGSSSNDELLRIIKPKAVAVCCCAGSTEYTANYQTIFPTQEFINRIAKYTDNVYVTSLLNEKTKEFESFNGNIIFESNGQEVGVSGSNNSKILKDSKWFNDKIYVKGNNISSGKGKDDFYISTTPNVKEVVRRIWPK